MEEKNKYLKIVISTILIILLLVGSIFIYKNLSKDKEKKEETQVETITPLLYEVTKEGSNNKIYLFGSIHAARKDDLNFPKYILDAYNNSHYLACELDQTGKEMDIQQQLIENIAYKDGTTIKDHLNESTYEKLVDFLTKRESYTNMLDYYKPYYFFSLISQLTSADANISPLYGIDNYFIDKAHKDNKTVLEVESYEYQLNLLLSFKDVFYDVAISEQIDEYDKEVDELKKLYDNWKKGNLEKLLVYRDDVDIKEEYTEEQKEAVLDYNKRLITDRNKTMTDKVIEYFNNNKDVFFMVGTFHIIGDDGLVNNLQANGYTVTQVK